MAKKKITTAIIGDNGFSTRRLPISSTLPKGFSTIGNRPVVDYVVDELVAAGIQTIYFVINPYHEDIYKRYFLGNDLLDEYLERKNKPDELKLLKDLRNRAEFKFVCRVPERYGTAIPPLMVHEEAGGLGDVIYLASDDFTVREDGGSDIADLLQCYYDRPDAVGALMGLELPMDILSNFGVMKLKEDGEFYILEQLVEKPKHPEKLGGHLVANIGKHVISNTLWPYIDKIEHDPEKGEYLIVDVYDKAAKKSEVVVYPAKGNYFDVGTLENWLVANAKLAE